jgi:Cu(I)/Ag(I) efflux system membrane fusion protein
VTYDRNLELHNQKVISASQFQKVRAEFESAEAAYQSLTEQMRHSARLTNTQARQSLRKAETAQRVAGSRLRMLGVSPDGGISEIVNGKVQGVNPDGSLTMPAESAATTLDDDRAPVTPIGAHAEGDPIAGTAGHTRPADRPVSSYPIWAPFDGTIIDRMMIVPGVYVDTTHRIFTLADLSTVWIEANIHETNYGAIIRGRDAKVRFTSPAYPDETFEAEVLYSGDMVDDKTRSLRLMARAQNPDRRLKPGMFVNVEIMIPEGKQVVLAPSSALLTEGGWQVMFVELGPDRFERREVKIAATRGDKVEVAEGLKPGEKVVSDGGFKLKAELILEREGAMDAEETAG